MAVVVSVSKEKNVIIINLDNGKNHTYNITTGETTTQRNTIARTDILRNLKFSNEFLSSEFAEIWKNFLVYGNFYHGFTFGEKVETRQKLEKFLSYLDLIDTNVTLFDLPNEIPKGYVKYLRENNKKFSNQTLKDFYRMDRINGLDNSTKETLLKLKANNYLFYDRIMKTNEQTGILKELVKIMSVTYKNFELIDGFYDLCRHIEEVGKDAQQVLDTNRGISYNYNLIREFQEDLKSDQIRKQQELIKDLPNLFNSNDLTIVVPLSVNELINEGKQQHNCVGHYYNDGVIGGKYFLYFIRQKQDFEHSYITARYNRQTEKTVEIRFCNNQDAYKQTTDIRKEIDEIIKKLTKTE